MVKRFSTVYGKKIVILKHHRISFVHGHVDYSLKIADLNWIAIVIKSGRVQIKKYFFAEC